MTASLTSSGPWLALAGLGLFHGLNPAMGWLFAVALGLHRQSRGVVFASLAPIAAGHTLSIWVVSSAVLALGAALDPRTLRIAAGALVLGWAAYHWLYGHRHRVRIGMTAGFAALALWSFLMASAHGAGVMLVPFMMPLCAGQPIDGGGVLSLSLAAAGVHSAAMVMATGIVAALVYEWLGLEALQRNWINFDRLWTAMLVVTGGLLVAL